MDGNFRPILVARNWVQDAFLGGSPDLVLERHRQERGTAGGPANLTIQPGDWPGYRGINRDGVATGPSLARDWSKSPPKEIWRQPVGGGYAAFAIANGFLVTIEQRREREVVVCYEAATGKEARARDQGLREEGILDHRRPPARGQATELRCALRRPRRRESRGQQPGRSGPDRQGAGSG
jgi:hypothetical protein